MGKRDVLRSGLLAFVTLLLGCDPAPKQVSKREEPVAAYANKPAPGGGSNGPFDRCLAELDGEEVRNVGVSVARTFRISDDDATDIARDAMLKVCIRHAERPYDRLAAALQQAAMNTAKRSWKRGKRFAECPIDDRLPRCNPWEEPPVRFDSELQLARTALCKESPLDQKIIERRVIDDVDFASVGADVGLTADQARTRYANAMNRVKARTRDGLCPSRFAKLERSSGWHR